jgi:molecular chaperone DnaK
MKKVIGIDLGTTNSVIAFKTKDVEVLRNSPDDKELTRSCVAKIEDEIIVGDVAFDNLRRDNINTITSVKRLMGGSINSSMVQEMIEHKDYYQFGIAALKGGTDDSVAVILGGKQFTPDQISSEILKKLKADAEKKLNDEVTHAVITVPAYFTPRQKNATLLAAHYAGLKVSKLLSEPTAAAIAYGVDNVKLGEAKTVLVYDFGGGTFDLSILVIAGGNFSQVATGGDPWLGGDDIDKALYKYILKKVASQYNLDDVENLIDKIKNKRKRLDLKFEFRNKIENAKKQLSSANKVKIDIYDAFEDENGDVIDIDIEISKSEFENLITPFIQNSIDLIDNLLKEVNYDIDMIDNILLVGGTSCIPLVKEMLVKKYGSEKILLDKTPMLAIAKGAAILAHRLDDSYEKPIIPTESEIEDITYVASQDMFIAYQQSEGNISWESKPIIEKQSVLPVTKIKSLKTTSNNQRIARFEIAAMVNGEYKDNQLAFLKIDENLPIETELIFEITLDIDEKFRIVAYLRGKQNNKKEVLLTSGQYDAKALRTIDEYLHKVTDEVGKCSLQEKFYSYASDMLDIAYQIGNSNPLSERWHEVDFKTKDKFDSVVAESNIESEDRSYIAAMSMILISEYRDFINPLTAQRLIQLLQQYDAAIDFEKEQFLDEMERINDNNSDFFIFHKLKLAAERAPNKPTPNIGNTEKVQDIQTLNRNHDAILNFYKNDNTTEAMNLLVASMPIVQKYL